MADRDTEIVEALDAAWTRIQAEAPQSIPAADFYLTEGRSTWCATTTWSEPVVLRINLMHEGQNRSGEDVMESLLHLGAHAMSRGSVGSPSQGEGRYHSAEFRDDAKILGLDAERRPTAGFGFGVVSMARGTKTRYRSEIAKLDRALARWAAVPIRAKSRAPIPLVCRCTPETIQAGLAKRGLPADTGLGDRGTKVIAAPKRIIAPSGVAARGGLRCDDCGAEFVPAEQGSQEVAEA